MNESITKLFVEQPSYTGSVKDVPDTLAVINSHKKSRDEKPCSVVIVLCKKKLKQNKLVHG